MEEERKCLNCGYYLKHYVVTARGLFTKTSCGHCANCNMALTVSDRIVKRNAGCAFWKPLSERKKEVENRVEDEIREMQRTLKKILFIIKNGYN